MEEEKVVDWLDLPDHLTFEIISKLTYFFDYERFGVVCVKWRSLLLDNEQHQYCPKLPPQLPLLLIPTPPPPCNNNELPLLSIPTPPPPCNNNNELPLLLIPTPPPPCNNEEEESEEVEEDEDEESEEVDEDEDEDEDEDDDDEDEDDDEEDDDDDEEEDDDDDEEEDEDDEEEDEDPYKYMKKHNVEDKDRTCSFYRITDKKVVCPQIQLKMPPYRHFRGSGHGWLVTIDDDKSSNYQVQLINPFFFPGPKVIPLPPLTAFPIELDRHGMILDTVWDALFVRKAVLTADPISNPNDYMVILIWGEYRRLAFFKPGEEAWTPIGYDSFKGLFEDVINYKGKVYAVHHHGTLAICNMEKRMAMKILEPPAGTVAPDRKYLVESSGYLLQVHRQTRRLIGPTYSTLGFKVFKLSLDPLGVKKPDWEEVKDLCGHALFLGYSLSLSIHASDFPGCKPNCIYYTDDNTESIDTSIDTSRSGPHDIGMFNLEDGSFEKHFPTNIHDSIWPNPIWIEPRLPPKKQAEENKVE